MVLNSFLSAFDTRRESRYLSRSERLPQSETTPGQQAPKSMNEMYWQAMSAFFFKTSVNFLHVIGPAVASEAWRGGAWVRPGVSTDFYYVPTTGT